MNEKVVDKMREGKQQTWSKNDRYNIRKGGGKSSQKMDETIVQKIIDKKVKKMGKNRF